MVHPKALVKLFGYNAELINKQLVGISHQDSVRQPPFEANCLNWTLGHIVSSRSFPLSLIGQPKVMSEEQRRIYRHGSSNIQSDAEGVIRLESLIAYFNESQERMIFGLEKMTFEQMCEPSGYRENTFGDSLAYFHFHETHQIGQIMFLAQSVGKEGVWIA